MPTEDAEVIAAGAIVVRRGGDVLVVHRPRYDDWSFPKGKLDPGEHVVTAAVREVAEETGLAIRLGRNLPKITYSVRNGRLRRKDVYYWVGYLEGDDDVSTYTPNEEVDAVEWMPAKQAFERLTYHFDRDSLEEVTRRPKRTSTLVVLRHGRAQAKKSWKHPDAERPLTSAGLYQAQQVAPVLAAYGVQRAVSSSSVRCVQTIEEYAAQVGLKIETTDDLSQSDATRDSVVEQVEAVLTTKEPTVLCTHRPVLPWVFEALGLEPTALEPGAMFVVHHRDGWVVATEQHDIMFR